ncbi:MAG: Crp/Fnr family transcriptional regulator [Bacteroidota bacterium]
MEALFQNIQQYIRLDKSLKSAIRESFQKKAYQKGDFLLKEGQYARRLIFIEEGTLRTFYVHENKEVTSWFYTEGYFVSSWNSFYTGTASYESIEALSDCTVYWIDSDRYQQLIEDHTGFERFARITAEQQLAFLDSFSKGYIYFTAKQKYEHLIRFIPDIELRVKLGQIASFLGISQETLSRIRAGQ